MVERYSRLMADYRRKESQLNIALNDLGKAERKIKELSRKLLKEGGKAIQYDDRMEEARQALEQQEEQFIQTIKLITAEKEAA